MQTLKQRRALRLVEPCRLSEAGPLQSHDEAFSFFRGLVHALLISAAFYALVAIVWAAGAE